MSVRSVPAALMYGAIVLVTVFVLAMGCTSSSASHAPPKKEYDPQTTILIGSAAVNPPVFVVDRGVTVTWLNTDTGYHTVTSDDGDPYAFMSPPLAGNDEYQWTFTLPGTYGYHCTENPSIKGTIIVNS